MGGNSPLGKYAAPVAAIVTVSIVLGYLASALLPNTPPDAASKLHDAFLLALGAAFASAVTVNGYKAPLTSAHGRIDRLQSAIMATAAKIKDPGIAAQVASILEDNRANSDDAQDGPVPSVGA